MKFIKDIIGEQRDRLQQAGTSLAPDPILPTPPASPVSGEESLPPDFLRLGALERVDEHNAREATVAEDPPATEDRFNALDQILGRAAEAPEPRTDLDAAESEMALSDWPEEEAQQPPHEAAPEPMILVTPEAEIDAILAEDAQQAPSFLDVVDREPEKGNRIFRRRKAEPTQSDTPPEPTPVGVPAPSLGRAAQTGAAQRAAGRAQRVKTRLLGFAPGQPASVDPFAAAGVSAPEPNVSAAPRPEDPPPFPVGWLVIASGPGRGASFTVGAGVTTLGRGTDQSLCLDFGDSSISRNTHAALAYDAENRSFFLGHGGKANLVRLNGKPVLSTETLRTGDTIRIGETTLRFVALCGADFDWSVGQATYGQTHAVAQ